MRSLRVLLPLSLVLAACQAAPIPVPKAPDPPKETPVVAPPVVRETPDAPFRAEAPKPGPHLTFVPPKIEEAKLKNGVRVLFVERHELPIVAIELVAEAGADQGTPGLAALTAAGLLLGTKTKSAEQIGDAFDAIGANYGASVVYDATIFHAQVLTEKLPDALALVAEVWTQSTFPADEIDREKSHRDNWIRQENDAPGAQLMRALDGALYPAASPYHVPTIGTVDALAPLKSADLTRFHARALAADKLTIIAAGDVKKESLLAELEKQFGSLHAGGAPATPPRAPAEDPKAPKLVAVDRPGATQSSVAVTLVGTDRKTKDFDALTVMNTILGGQFSSRLNLNLREAHAYTYGARSSFDFRHGAGPFIASSAVKHDVTAPALTEMLKEIDRLRTEPVSDEELADAKNNLIQQQVALFETAGETASALAGIAIHKLPLDEIATKAARIDKITKDDVKRVAAAYLPKEKLRVIIVGDLAAVKPELAKLGLGEPTVVVLTPPSKAGDAKKPEAKPAPKKTNP